MSLSSLKFKVNPQEQKNIERTDIRAVRGHLSYGLTGAGVSEDNGNLEPWFYCHTPGGEWGGL